MSDNTQYPTPSVPVAPIPSAPVSSPSPSYGVPAAGAPAYGAAAYGTPLAPPQRRPQDPSGLGLTALLLAIAGVVGSIIAVSIAAVASGPALLSSLQFAEQNNTFDLSILSPVRGWVLVGEISFWVGTALGIWAIVQGAFAMAARRGFGAGLAAVIVAAVGPVLFGLALTLAVTAGFVTAV